MGKNILLSIVGILITVSIIYLVYWIGKTVSYTIFYEDMVQDTIREMVDKQYLIGGK